MFTRYLCVKMLACFIACKIHLEFSNFDFLNGGEILEAAADVLTSNKWSNISGTMYSVGRKKHLNCIILFYEEIAPKFFLGFILGLIEMKYITPWQ